MEIQEYWYRKTKHAGELLDRASRLEKSGRLEEALQAVQCAVATYEGLERRFQSSFAHQLRHSLRILSRHLANNGLTEEALHVARRVVLMHEKVNPRLQEMLAPDLAKSLVNLSVRLSESGRRDEALNVAKRAAAIGEDVVQLGSGAHLLGLARSLDNLASRLAENGQHEEALQVGQRATTTFEDLARINGEGYLPSLAISLNGLGIRLFENGQHDQAVRVAQRAVAIFAAHAQVDPNCYGCDLAMSLTNLARHLRGSGRISEAVRIAWRAVGMHEQLALQSPETYLPDLARSLTDLAGALAEDGQRRSANAEAERAGTLLLNPKLDHLGDWGERAADLVKMLNQSEYLRPNSLLLRLLGHFVERTNVLSREAFDHELRALKRFCAHCVELARVHLQNTDADAFDAALGLLDQIALLLHSRDIRLMVVADQGRANPESQKGQIAALRREIVRMSLVRAALIEKSCKVGHESELPNHLEGNQDELKKMRREHHVRLDALVRQDLVFGAQHLHSIDVAIQLTLARWNSVSGSAAQVARLLLLELPQDGDQMQLLALWLPSTKGASRLVRLPDLWALAREHEHQQLQGQFHTLQLYARALRKGDIGEHDSELQEQVDSRSLVEPLVDRLGRALLDPLREAGIDLDGLHSLVLCSHGAAHTLPFAMLPEFRQTGANGEPVIRLLHYPGLPHALAAAERLKPAEHSSSVAVGAWVLAGDAALDSAVPLPMTLVERELVRGLLDPLGVQVLHTGEEVRERFAKEGEPAAGFMALCHAQHLNVHDSQLQLGGEPVKALEVMGWKQVPRVALLPVCLVGRARDDERGNAMGLVSALMIKGCEVVVGYTHPVADALSPWLTTLLVWHMGRGLDAWSAAHLARDQFARQDWPQEYQDQMRQAIASVLPKLIWDSRPPGELALEVQQRNEHVAHQSLRQALQGLARDWPWQGQVALTGLLADHDEGMLAGRVQAVCEGLFVPRQDIAGELALAMAEQAQSLQVFGRPGVHMTA